MSYIPEYKNLLKNISKTQLNVILKESRNKGVGLYATKIINKGDVIAYYKFKIFKRKDYDSPTNFKYTFEVYRKNGVEYKTLIGDIDLDCFPEPLDNIPFWAPFVNEPNKNEKSNAEIDIDTKGNYSDKTYSLAGETGIYKLVASKKIKPNDEI